MATSSATLQLVLKLKDQASKQLGTVRKSMDGLVSSAFNLKNAFVGLGLVAALTEVTSAFTEFDDSIRQVGAVAGATEQELVALTDAAKKMGAETAFSAVQASDGLNYLARAGFDVNQAIEALPKTLQLAAAGAVELGTAADITTNVMAAYGMSTDDLGRANDVLTKAFTSTNATLEELGTAFTYVGPIAKGVGGEFENLVGTLGALHSAGIKGSMAGTTLRGTLDALFNPTKEEAELMAELSSRIGGAGLQIQDASGDFVGFTEIVKQLETANFTAAEALRLFGQRAGPGMQALLGQGSEALAELDEKLRQSGGTAEKIAKQMEAGIGGATRSMISAFEGLKIELAEGFEGVAVEAIRFFREEIKEATATIQKLRATGKIEEWATAFVDAMKEGWEYTKIFISGLMKLEPLIMMLVGIAPEVVALASAWVILSKAQALAATTGKLLAFVMGKDVLNAITAATIGNVKYTLSAQKAAAAASFLGGVLAELRLALLKIAAVAAAAWAGWEIGKLINQLQVFGDGTVTVGQKVQDLYAIIFGPPDPGKLEAKLDELKGRFEEFKDFKLPDDLATRTTEELAKLNGMLAQSRGYWTLLKQEQELSLQSAIESFGRSSEEAQKWREELSKTNAKLKEIRGEVSKLSDLDSGFEKQITAAKNAQGSLVKLLQDLGNYQIDQIKKNQQAELDALEKQVQNKAILLEDAEKKRIEIIEKYAPQIEAERLKVLKDVAAAEIESQTEVLEMQRNRAIEEAEKEIQSKFELSLEKIKIEEDYQKAVEKLKTDTAARLESQTQSLYKKSKEEIQRRIEIQEAGEKELLAIKAAAIAEVDRLESQALLNAEDLAAIQTAFYKSESDKRLGISEEADRIRETAVREAAENRLNIEEEFLNKQIEQAKSYAAEMAKNTAAGSEERAAAVKKIQELESELVAFQAAKSKELADIQIEATESAKERKEAAIKAETDFRAAEYSKQIAAIELEEARGTVAVEEATAQKMEAEKLFTEYRIRSLIAVADKAAAEYGRESAEYQSAVESKLQAQAQLAELEQAIESLGETTEETGETAAAAAEKFTVSFTATGQQIDRVIESARKFGTTASFAVDTAKTSLSDLGKIMEENYNTITKFSATMASAYANVAGEQNQQISEMIDSFREIAKSAEEAGLSVNLLDMTLEQAAEDVAARTEAYRGFKEEIIALKKQFASVVVKFEGIEEIDVARDKFLSAAQEADGLGNKIIEMNQAFGTGDLSTAQEMADGIVETYEDIYNRAAEYIEQLKGEWQDYADKVEAIQNQILALNLSVEEKIRQARRQTMTEAEEWQDRRLEYEEVYAEAVRLQNEGLAEESAKKFQKAIDLASGLQQVVRDETGETVSTMGENTELSIRLMEQARAAAEDSLTQYQATLLQSQQGIQESIQTNTNWMVQFGSSIQAAVNQAERLQGAMGAATGGFGFGGFGMASGGTFRRYPSGRLPGTDTGRDEIGVKARFGEWFIHNEAAGFWGARIMDGINRPFSEMGRKLQEAMAIPAFAAGGPVGGASSVNVAFPSMANMGSFTMQGPGGPVQGFGPRDAVQAFIDEAEKSKWLRTQ